MIGKKISPVLEEIEDALWEFEAERNGRPEYSSGGFRAAIKIFISVLMDKMWELQQKEELDMQDRINMANKAGEEVRALVKTFTGIDPHKMYG